MNFNAGSFSGTGQILLQSTGTGANGYNAVITNDGSAIPGSTITIGPNIVLNSNNAPFTKGDVTAATFVPGSSVATISGGGGNTPNPATLNILGVISGSSDLSISPRFARDTDTSARYSGITVLSASNTYTGATIVNMNYTGATLRLGVDNALPTTTDLIFGTVNFATDSGPHAGILDLNGHNQQVSSLSYGNGNATPESYTITNESFGISTLTISGSTTPAHAFSGIIADYPLGGSVAIVKQGSGTLWLNNNGSSYSAGTQVNAGILQVGNAPGSGSLAATGFGPVVVASGALLISETGGGNVGAASTGLVTMQSGAILAPGGVGIAATQPLTVLGNLTLQASSAVDFDFGSSTQRDEVVVNGTLNFPATGQVNVNLNSLLTGSIVNGLPLFYVSSGAIGNFNPSAFKISASNVISPPAYSVVEDGDTIRLVVPPPVINALTWNTTSGTWDTTSANWTYSGSTTTYQETAAVNFGYISSDSTITVANVSGGGVNPGATTISNTANKYTFTGAGILTGSLTMLGAGTAELQMANAYAGGTNLDAGLLIVNGGDNRLGAAGGALTFAGGALQIAGTGLVSSRNIVVNIGGGTLDTNGFDSSTSGATTLNDSFTKAGDGDLQLQGPVNLGGSVPITVSGGSLTLSGGVSGSFALNIAGPGTTVLAATNSYTGGTSLTAGARLQFANAGYIPSSGFVTINGDSTLACTAPAGSQSMAATAIDVDTNGGMLEVAAGVNLTVKTLYALAAGNPLLKTGAGTLSFATGVGRVSGGNTIAPALGVSTGAVAFSDPAINSIQVNSGNYQGNLQLPSGARLNFIGSTNLMSPAAVGGGGGILTGDNSTLVGFSTNSSTPTATTITNTIQLAGLGKTLNIGATEGNILQIDTPLTGGGNVDITTTPGGEGGAGVVLLSQVNSYSGNTTICNNYASPTSGLGTAGFLRLGVNDTLPDTALVFGSTTSGVNGGALDLNGHVQHVASIQDLSSCDGITNSSAAVGTLHITGSAVTTFGSAMGKVAGVNSDITNNNIALVLDSTFDGTLTLDYDGLTVYGVGSSAVGNTYTGGTTVEGGTLVIASPYALPEGTALTVGNPAALSPGFHNTTVAVPEPGTLALLVAAVVAVMCSRRRLSATKTGG